MACMNRALIRELTERREWMYVIEREGEGGGIPGESSGLCGPLITGKKITQLCTL